MIAGWCASGILNNAYIDSYSLTVVKRGMNFSSFSYGVLLDTAVMILMTYLVGRKNLKQETAFLISNSESKKDYSIIDKLSNHITKFLPEKIRFSVRIALRKPITIILTMIAVMTAMTLVIMSISLNLSSKKVYDIQTEGRTYQWDTKYSGYLNENNNKRNNNDENNNNGNKINTKEEIRYLEEEVKLIVPSYKKASITQKIVGLENLNNLFQLVNKEGKNIDLPLGNQIIISEELEEVYGVKPGDKIKIIYNGKNYPCLVADIARNAEQKRIYISKDTLTKWIGNDANIYNGILSMRQPAERGKSVSMKERLEELDRAAVSNRTSAVLNQILGGVLGCLLIYLVILLNFNDSMKEILTLHLLGYRTKQINTMLISIYRPIIGFSFLIMIYPSIYICKSIQRNLSIQTNDYMPFQTNISVLIFTFILINIIYNAVKYAFGKKIRKIIIQEDIQKQLF
jgi:putative ABC transport system permease protein